MRHFKSVYTLLDTDYSLGQTLGSGEITDITIDYEDAPLVVEIWATPIDDKNNERVSVIIPYHAVEILVVK